MADVYSFQESKGFAFEESPGKARNQGRHPTGNGFIQMVGLCYGYFGWFPATQKWDFTKWHSQAVITEQRLESGVWRTNRYTISFPTYFSPFPDDRVTDVVVNQHEQTDNSNPAQGAPNQTRLYPSATVVRQEYRDANGELQFFWEMEVTGEERDYEILFDTVTARLEERINFPDRPRTDQYRVTYSDGGDNSVPFGVAGAGQKVFVALAVRFSANPFVLVPGFFQIWGGLPFGVIAATAKKARYLSLVPAQDVVAQQGERNGLFTANQIVSIGSLPNGIEIAEPGDFPPDFHSLFPESRSVSVSAWSAIRHRHVVPPDSLP